MFQFSDLSEIPPPNNDQAGEESQELDPPGEQPEEEPHRRRSLTFEDTMKEAVETPIQDSPIPSPSDSEEDPLPESEAVPPEAGEHGPQNVNEESLMVETSGVIYDAYIMEAVGDGVDFLQGDEDTIWPERDIHEAYEVCSFEFTMPKQHVEKCVKNFHAHEAYVTSAAKKAKGKCRFLTYHLKKNDCLMGPKLRN